jgi:hypothetical protein
MKLLVPVSLPLWLLCEARAEAEEHFGRYLNRKGVRGRDAQVRVHATAGLRATCAPVRPSKGLWRSGGGEPHAPSVFQRVGKRAAQMPLFGRRWWQKCGLQSTGEALGRERVFPCCALVV